MSGVEGCGSTIASPSPAPARTFPHHERLSISRIDGEFRGRVGHSLTSHMGESGTTSIMNSCNTYLCAVRPRPSAWEYDMRAHRERRLPAMQTAVIDAIEHERHAEEIHPRVIASDGDVVPFNNVVHANRPHAASLIRHLPPVENCR